MQLSANWWAACHLYPIGPLAGYTQVFFFYSSLVFSVVYISRNFYPNNGNFYLSLWIELVASSIHIHPVLMWGCMRCWCSPSVPSRRDFNPTVDQQEICSLMEAIKSEIWNERCSFGGVTVSDFRYCQLSESLSVCWAKSSSYRAIVVSLSRTRLATCKPNPNCSGPVVRDFVSSPNGKQVKQQPTPN